MCCQRMLTVKNFFLLLDDTSGYTYVALAMSLCDKDIRAIESL